MLDLQSENMQPDLEMVQAIHRRKTGALLRCSVESGAILGGGSDEDIERLAEYGRMIGTAFQIADDLLDIEGDPAKLGKAVGQDQIHGKMTYPAVVGVEKARQEGMDLVKRAAELAGGFGQAGRPLADLALYIMERTR